MLRPGERTRIVFSAFVPWELLHSLQICGKSEACPSGEAAGQVTRTFSQED